MPETHFPRRLMIVLIVSAAVLALLVGVGLYGLLLAPRIDELDAELHSARRR